MPSYVYNTVDQPIFPTSGKRFTASIDLAGLGGNTNFYKPMVEGVWYLQAGQPADARHARAGRIHPPVHAARRSCRSSRSCSSAANTASAASTSAPSARRIRQTGLVLGGNKSLLFNIEEQITIAGPVRADCVLRRRPGAARADDLQAAGSSCRVGGSLTRLHRAGQELHLAGLQDVDRPRDPLLHAGAERAVPADLRLQPAARGRAATTRFFPQKAFQFRFAVGSTF